MKPHLEPREKWYRVALCSSEIAQLEHAVWTDTNAVLFTLAAVAMNDGRERLARVYNRLSLLSGSYTLLLTSRMIPQQNGRICRKNVITVILRPGDELTIMPPCQETATKDGARELLVAA